MGWEASSCPHVIQCLLIIISSWLEMFRLLKDFHFIKSMEKNNVWLLVLPATLRVLVLQDALENGAIHFHEELQQQRRLAKMEKRE